ncbi:hypothetical protein [Burkholderia plantarii]|uniref:hypothetical protein n=1 Tax=Burkholderia plantarii TaxID=41899 RepID=UPI00114CAB77|nr:hypothetical protein [Burkholderia plantarii]
MLQTTKPRARPAFAFQFGEAGGVRKVPAWLVSFPGDRVVFADMSLDRALGAAFDWRLRCAARRGTASDPGATI